MGATEVNFMRSVLFAITIAACVTPAVAQSADPDDKRFSFHKVDDGFLRLDGRTGAVSLCTRPESGWTCRTVPDERSALEGEIARLGSENAELKRTLLDRGTALPGLPPRPPENVGAGKALPSDADVDRVMAFMEKIWRRTLDIVANAQRELANRW
jgi:hypothetical protein